MKKIILSTVCALLILSFVKDLAVKSSVELAVKKATGLMVKIEGLNIGFLTKRVIAIRGLKVYNPPGFAHKVLADVPEIYVDFDISTVFKDKMTLNEIRLHLKELTIDKNSAQKTNLASIKLPKSDSSKDFKINRFTLQAGKVSYRDDSKNPPEVKEFTLNLNEQFTGINGLSELIKVVLVKSITSTALRGFGDFDLNALKGSVAAALAQAQKDVVNQAVQETSEKLKLFLEGK